jgi:hypothetical protein
LQVVNFVVARMQADSQAYQARVSLYRGMWWLEFALLAAYVGPLWHSLLVYLDSCPFLPLFTWAHWFELVPHVVGSWHVPTLPGQLRQRRVADHRVAAWNSNRCRWRLHVLSAQVRPALWAGLSKVVCASDYRCISI